MPYSVGQMLGGRYEILAAMTPGAQGEVYRVQDGYLNKVGVLKLLNANQIAGGVWLEAQVLNHLSDDHILKILNADVILGQPYIVTALAEHGTLESALKANNDLGLPTDTVVDWIRQACMGVARAHDESLIHNDIKPANLFLKANGECLVGDFGFASLLPPPPVVGVAEGATPETAAPEVAGAWSAGNPPATFQTDVYSLGATAFWLLTGRPPVDLTGIAGGDAQMAAAASQQRPRVRDIAPHVPVAVANVIEKAIATNPDDRYQSVNELDAALGSRSSKPRQWTQTNPHVGHIRCWRGTQTGKASYTVCLEQSAAPTKLELTGRYESGARIHGAKRTCGKNGWAKAVRAMIDKLS